MPLTTYTAGEVLTASSLNANLSFAATNPVSKIAQVISVTKTDTFSASRAAGANTAVTGLSVSITPTSNTSKILITASVAGAAASIYQVSYGVARGGTLIGLGDAAGSRSRVGAVSATNASTPSMTSASLTYLDSPATTSATTYAIYAIGANDATRTYYINQSNADPNSLEGIRSSSTITVMEILA